MIFASDPSDGEAVLPRGMSRLLVATFCLAAGCGSNGAAPGVDGGATGGGPGGGGAGGGASEISFAEFKDRDWSARCAYSIRCGLAPNEAICAYQLFPRSQLFADVDSGRITYDPRLGATCLQEEYNTRRCALSELLRSDTACDLAFRGTVPDGGRCPDDGSCLSAHCNRGTCAEQTCCAGICEPRVEVGGSCAAPSAVCASGASCHTDAATGVRTCTPTRGRGAACTEGVECGSPLLCIYDAPTATSGLCGDLPQEGEPCTIGGCDDSADSCSGTSKTCARRSLVGEDCSTTGCVGYAACPPAPGTQKCVRLAQPGEGCQYDVDCITRVCDSTKNKCGAPVVAPVCP